LIVAVDQLRNRGPTGQILATSVDGRTFSTDAGTFFAERVDDVLRMADGSVGTLIGAVVFVQDQAGAQVAGFWLESAPDAPGRMNP
jgi:hypothetical protein